MLQIHFYRTDQADGYANAKDTNALRFISVPNTGESLTPTFTNTSTVRDALNTILAVADCFDGGFHLSLYLVDARTGRLLDALTYFNGRK